MFRPIDADAALNGPASRGKPALAQFFVKLVLLVIAATAASAGAAERIRAVRVWPAQDYTRITIESDRPIRHQLLLVKHPDRVVLDLDDVDFASVKRQIANKILPDDPYIAQMRAGRYKPGVVRVVLDLKAEVRPQVFTLNPVGDYRHRLVLDLYPLVPVDPLMALLQKPESQAAAGAPGTQAEPHAAQEPSGIEATAAAHGQEQAAKGRPVVARLVTIVVDPGHGGEDPGARGRGGTCEKNVTLAIARKLKAIIDDQPNMRAVLTRNGDYYVPLRVRVQKARRVHADLFVSIHADASVGRHARGSSVYALSERGATSTAARLLAKSENNADLIGGVNLGAKDHYLAMTLADLSLTAQINDSLKLGRAVLSELGDFNHLHHGGRVEQANFAVLKAPDIPSILVETAFISNPREERKLKNQAYQEKTAQAIFDGIKLYFAKNPPLARSTIAAIDKTDR